MIVRSLLILTVMPAGSDSIVKVFASFQHQYSNFNSLSIGRMIFYINFFLVSFALSNIWSYLFVFAKYYANVSNSQFGILAMALPALALFAKPTSCSIADANGVHKQLLISALSLFTLSYGSLGVLAYLKDPADHDHDNLAWIVMCGLMCIGYVCSACVFCMNDALASNYARKHNKSYGIMRAWSCIGWACGALLSMFVGDISWLPFRVPGLIIMSIAMIIDIILLSLWPYEEDFEMFHDGSTIEQRKMSMVGPNTMALLAQKKPRGSISRDMLERIKAGRSKSMGNLPRFNDHLRAPTESELKGEVVEAKKEEPKEYSNFQCQMMLVKLIATEHKSFMRYIFLFIIFGLVQGIVWNFQMDFFKERVATDAKEFEFMSTLSMIAQSVLGEILINLIVNKIIAAFGTSASMSMALVTLGLRCYYYANILPYLGVWWVVIGEAFQGPSLGLYWILIVDVGSHYALMVTDFMPEMKKRGMVRDRQHEEELSGCLRASMIGFMSSSMEGLGVAVGAFLGGLISASLGYDWLWNFCAFLAISVGFINIGWDLWRKLLFSREQKPIETKKTDWGSQMVELPKVVIEDVNSKL